MQLKILTVDDSRAVRIIVRKAFKTYNVEILEAANGVEGLAMAAKNLPDLILLDVTMPVMDGVEMLTKLKADPSLKSIPVIMLTAEAGREMVLKIAKLGIRDYIVKPFKEDVLNEKVGRIIDLRPITETQSKRKTLSDPCEILIVEDKPVIIQQITSGIRVPTWKIHGVASTGETIDYCQKAIPDVIIISLSLPDEAAYTLFRLLRSNMKTKYVPVFALAVKTDLHAQQQAQQFGFSSIITKPIDYEELETKVAKSINLDTSERYFVQESEFLLIRLPENASTSSVNEISAYLKPKISEAVDQGYSKVIFDVHSVRNVNMVLIKLLVDSMQICQELTLSYSLVGNPQIVQECRGFEESKDWKFHDSIDQAKAAF
ncbi:MAG: response regulator [Opitutales bacterium]|nr:response regulator [Opitutales bacterium]